MRKFVPGRAGQLADEAADASWRHLQVGPTIRWVAERGPKDWAEIQVRHGHAPGRDGQSSTWVTFAAHSSFGDGSHHWSALGERDWREALAGLSKTYVLTKLLGGEASRKREAQAFWDKVWTPFVDTMAAQLAAEREAAAIPAADDLGAEADEPELQPVP